jgi:hypothetical protein
MLSSQEMSFSALCARMLEVAVILLWKKYPLFVFACLVLSWSLFSGPEPRVLTAPVAWKRVAAVAAEPDGRRCTGANRHD